MPRYLARNTAVFDRSILISMYQQITPPTPAEIEAASAYRSESGMFHLFYQSHGNLALDQYGGYAEFLKSGKLALLASVTQKYELLRDARLYSGHGNGAGVLGTFGSSDLDRLTGLRWQYPGITSTSLEREVAEDTLVKRQGNLVLLEFRLCPGFRLFPMAATGQDHEFEFLLPPNFPCAVLSAERIQVRDRANVLCLVLQPIDA